MVADDLEKQLRRVGKKKKTAIAQKIIRHFFFWQICCFCLLQWLICKQIKRHFVVNINRIFELRYLDKLVRTVRICDRAGAEQIFSFETVCWFGKIGQICVEC